MTGAPPVIRLNRDSLVGVYLETVPSGKYMYVPWIDGDITALLSHPIIV